MKSARVFLLITSTLVAFSAVSAQDLESPASPAPASKKDPGVSGLPGMEAPETAVPAFEPTKTQQKAPASTGGAYVVQEGDTLWALAGTYYKDPFLWRQIWDANKSEIPDPNLIYPLQRFSIPGTSLPMAGSPARAAEEPEEEEAAAEPEEEMEETAAEASEPPAEEAEASVPAKATSKKAKLYTYDKGTYVAPDDWSGDGQIMGDLNKKIMISQQDVVYLNIGASNGVKPRMRATVYRKGRRIREPSSGYRVGILVRRVGTLEVTKDVGDETATAVVLTSYEPIQTGDVVKLEE